jgi:hypothetical protein
VPQAVITSSLIPVRPQGRHQDCACRGQSPLLRGDQVRVAPWHPLLGSRWLSEEPNPGDLMRPFSAEPMRMWPISTRVNKPENDDPSIVEPIELIKTAV